MGTRHFCETILGDKKKEKYTVAEVIELTKGQYGAESFKEFFKKQRNAEYVGQYERVSVQDFGIIGRI